jgi:hypothetical protein
LNNYRYSSGVSDMYIHNAETNTVVTYLQTEPWCLLLQRTSDELMNWMITYTAMFAELENHCFVQLTGPAIAKLNKTINTAKLERPIKATHGTPNTNVTPRDSHIAAVGTTMSAAAVGAAPPLTRSNSLPITPSRGHVVSGSTATAVTIASSSFVRPIIGLAPTAASSRVKSKSLRLKLRPLAPKFVPLITSLPRTTMFYRAPTKSEVGLPHQRQ